MPPTHFRPLDLGEILDAGFTLFRRHFATFVSTGLLGLLPFVVLVALFVPVLVADLSEDVLTAAVVGLGVLAVPVFVVGTIAMWGALTRQVSQAYLGEEVSVRDGFSHAFRRLLALTGAGFLSFLVIGLGFVFCIVPGVLAAIVLFAVFPVVVLEGRGPLEAMSRSRQLSDGGWGRIFLTYLLVIAITSVPGVALYALLVMGMLGVTVLGSGSEAALIGLMVVYQLLSLLVSAATTPFLVIGTVLLYYDARIRKEALDLELATRGLALDSGPSPA